MHTNTHETVEQDFLKRFPNAEFIEPGTLVTIYPNVNAFYVIKDCGEYVIVNSLKNITSNNATSQEVKKNAINVVSQNLHVEYRDLRYYKTEQGIGAFPYNREQFSANKHVNYLENYISTLSNSEKYDLFVYLTFFAANYDFVEHIILCLKHQAIERLQKLLKEYDLRYIPSFGRGYQLSTTPYQLSVDQFFNSDDSIRFNLFETDKTVTMSKSDLLGHLIRVYNSISEKTVDGTLNTLNDFELMIYYRIQGVLVKLNPCNGDWFVSPSLSSEEIFVERNELMNFVLITDKIKTNLHLDFISKTVYYNPEDSFAKLEYPNAVDYFSNSSSLVQQQISAFTMLASDSLGRFNSLVQLLKETTRYTFKKEAANNNSCHRFKFISAKRDENGANFNLPYAKADFSSEKTYAVSFDWDSYYEILCTMVFKITHCAVDILTLPELMFYYKTQYISVLPNRDNTFTVLDEVGIKGIKDVVLTKEQIQNPHFVLSSLRS